VGLVARGRFELPSPAPKASTLWDASHLKALTERAVAPLEFMRWREKFYAWLLSEHSVKHAKDLISYSEKYMPAVVKDPLELRAVYDSIQTSKRHFALAVRNFLNFLEQFALLDEYSIEKYRRVVKVPKTGSDSYVPTDEEVKRAYSKIASEEFSLMYKLISYSGIRLVEAVNLVNGFDYTRFMLYENVAKYPLQMMRGTKNVLYAYLPKEFAPTLRRLQLRESCVRQWFSRLGMPAKYLRKWHYNFMLSNGVPESVCDFIQGRSLHTVGSLHYLAKVRQADEWYNRVVEKLLKVFPD
jgi:intergrase/recombinase